MHFICFSKELLLFPASGHVQLVMVLTLPTGNCLYFGEQILLSLGHTKSEKYKVQDKMKPQFRQFLFHCEKKRIMCHCLEHYRKQ